MIETVGIFGVGGVGGYFGGKLCRIQNDTSRVKISFLARGAHLRAIQENGLILKTEQEGSLNCRPAFATDSVEALPEFDLCILCVKEFDLHGLLLSIKDRIRESTLILPLLNGVDVYARIRSVIDKGVVLPACVYVGTHIEKPGVVSQNGGACKILLGADPRHLEFAPDGLLELLGQANILHDWRPDIQTCIWEKFIFISSFGLVTASHNKTIGDVLEDGELRGEVLAIVKEAISIARGLGVEIPKNTSDAVFRKGRSFPYETKTSFQRDFENHEKADERNLFAGALLKYANELGIHVPTTAETLRRLEAIKPSSKKASTATPFSPAP